MIQYSGSSWQNKNSQYPNVIDDIDNKTHYADFPNIQEWRQLLFLVKSVTNTTALSPDKSYGTAMPEMQFFGLPSDADKINKSTVATVSYLKAEDSNGVLHDILGRHQWLPFLTSESTSVRIYWGEFSSNVAENNGAIPFYFKDSNGISHGSNYNNTVYNKDVKEIDAPYDSRTALRDYELYVYATNGEKIILSSGYIGNPPNPGGLP